MIKTSKENERLAEMLSVFKNKLIIENCFQQVFAATKCSTNLHQFKKG
jgi:hypothetical protein